MACTLRMIRFDRRFDTNTTDSQSDNVEELKAVPELESSKNFLIYKLYKYKDKFARMIDGSQDQYRMYLITTLLPSQTDQPLINRILPKELILRCVKKSRFRIFSFLDITSLCRCAETCRQWNMLALDGSNWQQVDLFRFQKDIKAPVVENLAKRCGGFLKKLSLRGCENVQEAALRSFTLRCPNIEHLSLYKCKRVTDSTCDYLGRNCHRMLWLDLENCTAITDKSLKAISEGCRQLEYLNISWCENIQDRGVQSILQGCSKLSTLICRGCEGITENVFTDMGAYCKELRALNLLGCFIVDDTVADIAAGCRSLEYLCLSMCSQITDRSLICLANGCPCLGNCLILDIELAGCSLLSDHGFAVLAKACNQLERMDLENCSLITDVTLQNLSKGCPRLVNLSLSHCELITDAGLRQLCLNHNLRERLVILELDNCPQITDVSLDYMRQVRSMQRIDLYDCQNITKDAIKRFKSLKPDVEVHAYFAPATPPVSAQPVRSGICRRCVIL
uniref:F-box domain-containing protein n=1 Tax=Ascaris lumbricoides TaxID=6252 RepID=A0A9J2P2H8_ASCLU